MEGKVSKVKRLLVTAPIILAGGAIGAVLGIALLMAVGNWLGAYLFGAPQSGALLYWLSALAIGALLMAAAGFLGERKWRISQAALSESVIARTLMLSVLIGAGVGILWLSLSQVVLGVLLS